MQGFLELANIPYVGAGVLGSALGMDKGKMKEVLRYHGLPVPDWVALRRWQWGQEREAVLRAASGFGFPCFVKPANLGSSVGVSKAHTPTSSPQPSRRPSATTRRSSSSPSSTAARSRSPSWATITRGPPSRGRSCPATSSTTTAPSTWTGAPSCTSRPPSPPRRPNAARDLAVAAFLALECSGLARVDFFLHRHSGEVLLNEINTLPGFTPISMYPKLWEASGVSYSQLIDRLLQLAVERWQERTGAPSPSSVTADAERDDR